MDRLKLNELIKDKYISVQKHQKSDLLIYNYTHQCQFEKKWTEETMQCRGLIMDGDGNIVARPFPKFFNLEEYQGEIPNEPFEVFDKLDGSLGILYWIAGEPYIATRGSFNSDQAIRGTKIFRKKYGEIAHQLNKNYTYLFEIIYPENRIVVDYGNTEELILLAVIDTATGEEAPYEVIQETPFVYVERFNDLTDLKKLKELEGKNREGFVIRFASGLRLKVKFDEYVRLHRIMTNLDERRIWECMKEGKPLTEVLENVPDEFFDQVKATETRIWLKRKVYEAYVREYYEKIPKNFEDTADPKEIRKRQALFIAKEIGKPLRGIMFAKLSGKDVEPMIWDLAYPQYCTIYNCTFKNSQADFCLEHYRTIVR